MLLIDTADNKGTPEITHLIAQAVPYAVVNLNAQKMGDFFFGNYEGKKLQFSRKQAIELLGNIDEAEDQLRDYYQSADYSFQIVEGIISPYKIGSISREARNTTSSVRDIGSKLYGYKVYPNGRLEGQGFNGVSQSMLYAWEHRLAMAGIPTYYTMDYIETARLLITIYRNEQKPPEEHSTLERVIRPRLQLREASDFVKALMYISHAYKLGVGEKTAVAIESRFKSIFDLAFAEVEEICEIEGIGKTTAVKILKAIGREV